MITIDSGLLNEYQSALEAAKVPNVQWRHFDKWLRFYLDFCQKYGFSNEDPNSLPRFVEKLRSKKQNEFMQNQAIGAVNIY